jgi:hypothetical protein
MTPNTPHPSFTHRANSDYTVVDRNPLQLNPGDSVRLGPTDASWPGWVWVSVVDGRGTFVPEDHLSTATEGHASVAKAFNARDLSVKRHEAIIALREVKGWLWCRNEAGEEGWLPAFVLEIH